ncbi:MAG: hypothetical protein QOC92_4875, partial [Acidimicrobiaceae bacterium]
MIIAAQFAGSEALLLIVVVALIAYLSFLGLAEMGLSRAT